MYAILFLNMFVTSLFSAVDIVAFGFVTTKQYMLLSLALTIESLHLHCTAWFVTSLFRYIYIEHEEWIHMLILSVRKQAVVAVCLTLLVYPFFGFPPYGFAMTLGKGLHC